MEKGFLHFRLSFGSKHKIGEFAPYLAFPTRQPGDEIWASLPALHRNAHTCLDCSEIQLRNTKMEKYKYKIQSTCIALHNVRCTYKLALLPPNFSLWNTALLGVALEWCVQCGGEEGILACRLPLTTPPLYIFPDSPMTHQQTLPGRGFEILDWIISDIVINPLMLFLCQLSNVFLDFCLHDQTSFRHLTYCFPKLYFRDRE